MADPIDIAVGARVRMRRREIGVSQEALADHLRLSFQQVQKYERGANRISASMLVRTAERLSCSVAFLVGEQGNSEDPNAQSILAHLASPGMADLVEAFSSVENTRRRSAVIQLVRSLAED